MRTNLLILFVIAVFRIEGQEIHFSQFIATPLLTNPALTGFFDRQIRAGISYRNQGALISTPYHTCSAYADGVIQPYIMRNDWFGAGGVFTGDLAGDGAMQRNAVYLASAYHKSLNRTGTLFASLGFAVGAVNRSVDYSNLVFGNQWNGTTFDPTLPAHEKYTETSFYYLDINTGVMVSWRFDPRNTISGGLALNHVNKPTETFYESGERMEWRWTLHALTNLRLNDRFTLEAGIIDQDLSGLSELVAGANLLFGKGDLGIYSGLWYRFNTEIIPMAGIDYHGYRVMFSYDITISSLGRANYYQGGFEISARKTFKIKAGNNKCQGFSF